MGVNETIIYVSADFHVCWNLSPNVLSFWKTKAKMFFIQDFKMVHSKPDLCGYQK